MATGFYELLGVSPDASAPQIRSAWQEQVATVVRKIRAAEARQLDLSPLEARREALAEAWAVLSDPVRRRRYDRYRELSRGTLPTNPDDLWAAAGASLVDPAAAAALELVRTLTSLRVGDGFSAPTPVPVEVDLPEPEVVAQPTGVEPEIPPAPVVPSPRRPVVRAPQQLEIDASVPGEDLERLLDLYGPTGAYLRAVREARGITLDQLSSVSRISLRFLDAMERDAFAELPTATFVRGYLRTVARCLEALHPGEELEEYVEDWMARYHRARD
jgi:curved DNA-binding protein CbpA